MTIPAHVIAKLAVLGLSRDHAEAVASMLADVEAATKAEAASAIEARRANDRARKERQRHGKSRDVTGQHVTARDKRDIAQNGENPPVLDAPRVSTRAEPETNNSSENTEGKEERKEEPPAAVAPSPKPSKTLCPSEFEPSTKALDLGFSLGLDRAAVFEARDTMVAWSRGNGEKRLDWDAVFGNWLRRDAKDRAKARGSPPRGQAAADAAMMALNRAAHQRLLELDDDDAWQQAALGPPG